VGVVGLLGSSASVWVGSDSSKGDDGNGYWAAVVGVLPVSISPMRGFKYGLRDRGREGVMSAPGPLEVSTLISRGSDSSWKGAFSLGISGVIFRASGIRCGRVVVLEVAVLASSDFDTG
jgi:hypothetical protein